MRIAIIAEVFLPKVDGVVLRTLNLLGRLTAQGDELLVVCPEITGNTNCQVPTVEFRSFPCPSYPEYRIGLPDDRLVSEINSFKPDVLHYINPFAFGFRCFDLLEKAGVDIPTVFSFHTLYGEFVKRYPGLQALSRTLWWLMRCYHNNADANLTVSSIMRNDLTRRGFERVSVWPPAVDSELFCPDRASVAMRNRLSNGHPDEPLLITVSRLAPEKNLSLLAEVMERLPEGRLAIVGDGPHRTALERRFRGTRTNFVGYLAGQELANAYASADAFLYASETETMGNVVLEAMACGLSVVAPRAGGIPSLVTHGETGLLFTPGDSTEAAGQVRQLLADHQRRRSLGAAARQWAAGCDWNCAAKSVRESYRQAISDHAARSGSVGDRKLAPFVLESLIFAFRASATVGGLLHRAATLPLTNPNQVESTGRRFLHDTGNLYGR